MKRFRLTLIFIASALVVSAVVTVVVSSVTGQRATSHLVALASNQAVQEARHIQGMITTAANVEIHAAHGHTDAHTTEGQASAHWLHGLMGLGGVEDSHSTGQKGNDALHTTDGMAGMSHSYSAGQEGEDVSLTIEFLAGPNGLPSQYRTLTRGLNIVKLKLFDADGMTVWSTDPTEVGEVKHNHPLFLSALGGDVESKFERGKMIAGLDGMSRQLDIVETYTPLQDPVSGRTIGVMELYSDVTEDTGFVIDHAQSQSRREIPIFMGILFLLLSSFVIVADVSVQRAARREVSEVEAQIKQRRRAEVRYRELMENANDGVLIFDASTGLIREFNSRAAEMLGVTSRENLLGRHVSMVHPEAMVETTKRHVGEVMEQGYTVFDDLPFIREDGSLLAARPRII